MLGRKYTQKTHHTRNVCNYSNKEFWSVLYMSISTGGDGMQMCNTVEPRTPPAWAASAQPLSHDSRTTTNAHNPLYVLHRWYWMPQSHTWQPLSMCYQNSIRGRPENSLCQERTHAECFFSLEINEFRCYEAKIKESENGRQPEFWQHMLSDCQVYHLPPVQYIQRIVRVGSCPAVVAQWQSAGGSSQRCPGFDFRWLPAFSLSSIFAS